MTPRNISSPPPAAPEGLTAPLVTQEEIQEIERQLGRRPRGLIAVAVRCPAGHPAVALCSPLIQTPQGPAPFPTVYWLTCPRLRAIVSEVERTGGIGQARALIAGDGALREALARDHRRYAEARWDLLDGAGREWARKRGWDAQWRGRGIAGAQHPWAVKCLHAHLAHHLAAGNTLGRWLEEQYGVAMCGAK